MLAWRGLSVVLALVIAFFGVIEFVVAIIYLDWPLCEDAGYYEDCFDGPSSERIGSSLLAFPAGILGVAALVASIFFASTGRKNLLMILLGVPAALLVVAWIIVIG